MRSTRTGDSEGRRQVSHMCPYDKCSRPAHDGWTLCDQHAWELETALGDIPALNEELNTTLSRQTASGQRHGARSTEKPLAFDAGASEATYVLRNTLVGWVRDLLPDPTPGNDWPADRVDAMARWLLARIDQLRTHPAAEQLVDEIGAAVRECTRAIDRRAAMVYAGTCACGEGLYAAVGRANVACRGCGARHTVADCLEALRASLYDRLLSAAEIARMAAYLGDLLDRERVRKLIAKWEQRGVITAHGINHRGEPTYPFGDTLARLLEAKERKTG